MCFFWPRYVGTKHFLRGAGKLFVLTPEHWLRWFKTSLSTKRDECQCCKFASMNNSDIVNHFLPESHIVSALVHLMPKVAHLMARVAYLLASLAYIRRKKASALGRHKQHAAAVLEYQTPTGGEAVRESILLGKGSKKN